MNKAIDITTIEKIAIGLKYFFSSVLMSFVFLFLKQPYMDITMKPKVNIAAQFAIKSAKLYKLSIPLPYPAPS